MTDIDKPIILVTGAAGQVGFELLRSMQGLGQVVAADRRMLDLSDLGQVARVVRDLRPTLIVNAAAYTAVDQAEADVALADRVNGDAPGVLAEEAAKVGAALIHYSTDYVFDGGKAGSYDESDSPNPLNAYGKTKLHGERAVVEAGGKSLVFRTSWVYGAHGRNFLRTMMRLARERSELSIVDDQIGAPTWSATIAALTAHIATQVLHERIDDVDWWRKNAGIYHLTASGATSWAGFAEAIFESMPEEARPTVNRISTEAYPTLAQRPRNSRLSCSKLTSVFSVYPPDWREALGSCVSTL
ncbi:dTDP-4-dehydrorhamnose reductase [Burkholderia sp. lig30]|jgi:dTDP-4-dehydrorhamnose reductase|uniref:dTDP-4-dehydrorhamnose reductase n=1 Tax=Burkholderia sp. lig30 TaxID=1192124 RepID=UPI000461F1C2|nr:dTDP-4-dehydrorhamnose reductase [Burkholderia sp. lig30]KDB08757.1 dTDP-4-dehydrorhamnose reductase [Burkholderia sp. lig30]